MILIPGKIGLEHPLEGNPNDQISLRLKDFHHCIHFKISSLCDYSLNRRKISSFAKTKVVKIFSFYF